MTKLEKHIATLAPRERELYDYLVETYKTAADDLRCLHRDADNYLNRSARIDDRMNHAAYTLHLLNIHITCDVHNGYRIGIELFR